MCYSAMPVGSKNDTSGAMRNADEQQAERLHRFAHDLRNRLAAIQQVLHLVQDPPEGMGPGELMEFGEQQYFKAMRDVEDLLDEFSVDRTYRLTEPGQVDLAGIVPGAIRTMDHRTKRKEQRVLFTGKGEFSVRGDPRILTELVSALLSNASKFSPKGGPITIHLTRSSGMIKLSVRDEGIGLDEADSSMVFHRYAWLKGKSTDGEAQGRSTLARAREWAKAHGGELSVHSSGIGKGTTFTLDLPAWEDPR